MIAADCRPCGAHWPMGNTQPWVRFAHPRLQTSAPSGLIRKHSRGLSSSGGMRHMGTGTSRGFVMNMNRGSASAFSSPAFRAHRSVQIETGCLGPSLGAPRLGKLPECGSVRHSCWIWNTPAGARVHGLDEEVLHGRSSNACHWLLAPLTDHRAPANVSRRRIKPDNSILRLAPSVEGGRPGSQAPA